MPCAPLTTPPATIPSSCRSCCLPLERFRGEARVRLRASARRLIPPGAPALVAHVAARPGDADDRERAGCQDPGEQPQARHGARSQRGALLEIFAVSAIPLDVSNTGKGTLWRISLLGSPICRATDRRNPLLWNCSVSFVIMRATSTGRKILSLISMWSALLQPVMLGKLDKFDIQLIESRVDLYAVLWL